jgi:hypothetical protein
MWRPGTRNLPQTGNPQYRHGRDHPVQKGAAARDGYGLRPSPSPAGILTLIDAVLSLIAAPQDESATAQSNQSAPYPVGDSGPLSYKAIALTVRTPRILFCQRRNRRHLTMLRLPPQPSEKGTLQHLYRVGQSSPTNVPAIPQRWPRE